MDLRMLMHTFSVLVTSLAEAYLNRAYSNGQGAAGRYIFSAVLNVARLSLVSVVWIAWMRRLHLTFTIPVEALQQELSHLHRLPCTLAAIGHHWTFGWQVAGLQMPSGRLHQRTCVVFTLSLCCIITLTALVRSEDTVGGALLILTRVGALALAAASGSHKR